VVLESHSYEYCILGSIILAYTFKKGIYDIYNSSLFNTVVTAYLPAYNIVTTVTDTVIITAVAPLVKDTTAVKYMATATEVVSI
jgi:hypothetical protein